MWYSNRVKYLSNPFNLKRIFYQHFGRNIVPCNTNRPMGLITTAFCLLKKYKVFFKSRPFALKRTVLCLYNDYVLFTSKSKLIRAWSHKLHAQYIAWCSISTAILANAFLLLLCSSNAARGTNTVLDRERPAKSTLTAFYIMALAFLNTLRTQK